MTPAELAELIRSGEDSGLEFKRDDIQNHDLAKQLVAFLNLDGGTILLVWRTMALSPERPERISMSGWPSSVVRRSSLR